MKKLHISGKWEVSDIMLNYPDGSKSFDVKVNNQEVATVYGKDANEAEANARLIASAPELLEVLDEVMSYDGIVNYLGREIVSKVNAVVAKATGESLTNQTND